MLSSDDCRDVSRRLLKPKFHYADFKDSVKVRGVTWKFRTFKLSRHVEMFATKFVTSPRQIRLCRSDGV